MQDVEGMVFPPEVQCDRLVGHMKVCCRYAVPEDRNPAVPELLSDGSDTEVVRCYNPVVYCAPDRSLVACLWD